jgi:hypothetical protein
MTPSPYWLIAAAVLLLVAAGRVHELWTRARLGRYAVLLEPQAREWLAELRREVEEDRTVAEVHAELAREQWQMSRDEAVSNLEALAQHFERTVQPNLGALIHELRVAARTVKVVAPPRPLGAAAYRLWRLRGWSGLGLLAHWLLVTGWQRVRVRVWFLARGLKVVVRAVTGASLLAVRRGRWSPTIDAAVADFNTWGGEVVTTAESILEAVARWRARRTPER